VRSGHPARPDTVSAGFTVPSVGPRQFLCVAGHISAPDVTVAEAAFWEIYDDEGE
jgi:hypothetical protein